MAAGAKRADGPGAGDGSGAGAMARLLPVRWRSGARAAAFYNIVHGDAYMAFVIDAFSVEDQQDLGRFVLDAEISCDLIGYRPVVYQVEAVKIYRIRGPGSFQPAFDHSAGGAAGTVLKNNLWPSG